MDSTWCGKCKSNHILVGIFLTLLIIFLCTFIVIPDVLSKTVPIWCAVVNRASFLTETAYPTINTLKYASSPKLQCSFLLAFPHSFLTAQKLPSHSAHFHMHLFLFNTIGHSLVFVLKLCYNPLSFLKEVTTYPMYANIFARNSLHQDV